MHRAVLVSHEAARGCGFRKPGGLYLVARGPGRPCGKLPLPLEICPTCGAGIKPTRGWTWVNSTALAATVACRLPECDGLCPMARGVGRAGLLWIGEKFYPRPADWLDEAQRMGVSRRIATVPRDFELGKTWVLAAHRKGLRCPDGSFTPAVFRVFQPTAVQVVVSGEESDEQIERLLERGLQPVKVVQTRDQHERR